MAQHSHDDPPNGDRQTPPARRARRRSYVRPKTIANRDDGTTRVGRVTEVGYAAPVVNERIPQPPPAPLPAPLDPETSEPKPPAAQPTTHTKAMVALASLVVLMIVAFVRAMLTTP